jgi:hypothetical protein
MASQLRHSPWRIGTIVAAIRALLHIDHDHTA